MSWTKKILLGILGVLVLVVLALYLFLQSKTPRYSGEVEIAGLEKPVDVAFDDYGIPHIKAQSSQDAYMALGYVHASERLFQMELLRRIAKGKLAEILGKELLEVDELFLTLGLDKHGKKCAARYKENQPRSFKETKSYVDGINAYIKEGKKPIEFHLMGIDLEPFELEDCFAISGYMAFSFAVAMRTDPHVSYILDKYGQNYLDALNLNREGNQFEIPVLNTDSTDVESDVENAIGTITDKIPLGLFHGSNGFVLAGSKTRSGKPILVNDTHIRYSQPAVWYESRISYPGHNVYGNYLAGFPYAVIGHTDHHSWGMTMFEIDDMDFFVEEYNPSNTDQIRKDSTWIDLTIDQYEIKIKGQEEPQQLRVKTGPHGPIVNDVIKEVRLVTAKPVALKWVYTDFLSENLEASLALTESKSKSEAFEAMSMIHSPGINMVYADINDNIAWWGLSKIPIRAKGTHGKSFYRGYNSEDDYAGYLKFEENPHDINPSSGIIVNTNNQPESYAGHLHPGYYVPKDRYRRIYGKLEAKEDWTPEEVQQVILDHVNPAYPEMVQELISALSDENQSHNLIAALSTWDGNHGLDSYLPSIFYRWMYHIERLACEDELGDELFASWISNHMHKRSYPKFISYPNNPWWDNVSTEEVESRSDIFNEAWGETLEELESFFGTSNAENWKWRGARNLVHKHALGDLPVINKYFNVGPYDMPGGVETVLNQLFTNDSTCVHEISGGPAIRRVIDMAHPDSSWNVLPTGQSGHPSSKHYGDQAGLYHNGEYRMQWMKSNFEDGWRLMQLIPGE